MVGTVSGDIPRAASSANGVSPLGTLVAQALLDHTREHDRGLPAIGLLGSKIVAVTIDGLPLDTAADYRVITDVFLAGGGDGFSGFATGVDRSAPEGTSLDALVAYLSANSPVAPPATVHVTALP